jgi:hypothetical protein
VLTRLAYSVSATVTSRCADRAPSEHPRGECRFGGGRVILDAIDRLPGQAGRLCDAGNAGRAGAGHSSHVVELPAGVARLAAKVLGRVLFLCMLDPAR